MLNLIALKPIEKKIAKLIVEPLEYIDLELIRIKFFLNKSNKLQIFIDKNNYEKIEISDCEKASNSISTILDVEDLIKSEYRLEVSSPGINRPLTRLKDFEYWQGNKINIKTSEIIENKQSFFGILRGIEKDEILLEFNDNIISINLNWILEANLNII